MKPSVRYTLEQSLHKTEKPIICEICQELHSFGVQFYVNNGDLWVTICKQCIKTIYETVQE